MPWEWPKKWQKDKKKIKKRSTVIRNVLREGESGSSGRLAFRRHRAGRSALQAGEKE